MLENASNALKSVENATVLDISAKCDAAVAALDEIAEYASAVAEDLADRTSTTLADMSTGRYGINRTSVTTVVFSADDGNDSSDAAVSKPAPAWQRAVARSSSAVANAVLSVLEAVIPGERPETKPASKRVRLGNLLGFEWNVTRQPSEPSAARPPQKLPPQPAAARSPQADGAAGARAARQGADAE